MKLTKQKTKKNTLSFTMNIFRAYNTFLYRTNSQWNVSQYIIVMFGLSLIFYILYIYNIERK